MLKELSRIYENCPARVAAYSRRRWIATVTAWMLIFVAFLLSTSGMWSTAVCLVIALLGGLAGGLSLWFAAQLDCFHGRSSSAAEQRVGCGARTL